VAAPSKELLARDWIAYWKHHDATGEFPESEASFAVDGLAHRDPELCWIVILEILSAIDADPSNPLFQALAAGPLEDLLSYHGDLLIERVESQAHSDPRFKLLLGGVWQNAMTQELWSRVQAARRGAW